MSYDGYLVEIFFFYINSYSLSLNTKIYSIIYALNYLYRYYSNLTGTDTFTLQICLHKYKAETGNEFLFFLKTKIKPKPKPKF